MDSQHFREPDYTATRSEGRENLALDILSIVRIVRRRLPLIIGLAVIFAVITAAYSLTLTPIFSASSQVLFEPLVRQPFDDPNRPSRTGQSSEVMDSQISVINSDTVLRPVARENKLVEDPYFGEGVPGLFSQLKAFVFGAEKKDALTLEAQESAAVEALSEATTAKRVGQTFVINISTEAPSPMQAAVLANAVAESYLADQRRQVSRAAEETAAQIDDRLVDLRERLRQAEYDIQKFKAQNKLQSSNEGLLLTDQELSGVNSRLIEARSSLATATAKYDEIQRVLKNGVDAEAIGDVVNSGTISSLRQQYAQAARNEAQLLAALLPSHPSVIRARSQLESLRRLIRDEVERIAQSARIDLQVSQEQVAKLEQQLDSARGLSNADETASIKLRELETEAQATRQLYEIALSRAKEISQLEQVVVPNARIISPAIPPESSIYPKRKIMVILAGLLGLMLGTILAVTGEAIRIAKRHFFAQFPEMAAASSALTNPAIPSAPEPIDRHKTGTSQEKNISARLLALKKARSRPKADTDSRPEKNLKVIAKLPWLSQADQVGIEQPISSDAIATVQETLARYAIGIRCPNTRFAEAVDRIVAEILKTPANHVAHVSFLTSPTLGHGQTITAFALAVCAAHQGLEVLLADGEPKQRMLSHDLSIDQDEQDGPLRERVRDYSELGISFVSLVSGLPKYKHHRMNIRDAFEFADIARNYDLVIIDGVALPQLAEDDPLVGLATNFLVTVAEHEEEQISMPILAKDMLTIAADRPVGLVRTMTNGTVPRGRKYA
ncbi:exopolysaccharide transport family protein [Roseibium sp. LAB1]